MFLSNVSIRRPVAMSCLIIGLTLLGLNAWRKVGLELMPKVDVPYITITTVYPGASPSEIETDIARKIEDEVVSIDGLKHVSSTCMENACQTLLEFHLDVDVDLAATDVREKIDLVRADLPAGTENPQILKYDINAKPILTLALTGDRTVEELYDYADNDLRDRLTVIAGVADATLVGGVEREVHVLLDRDRLAGRGLSSAQVAEAIADSVTTIPSGRIRDRGTEYSVKFDADPAEVEEINDLPIAGDARGRTYLRDVGRAVMTTEELRQAADIDGRPCVAIKVVKKSDANAVAVVRAARVAVDELRNDLPGGMDLVWVTDDGTFTEATNRSAWINVGQGIFLTAAILFVFLYNLRALLVVAITMPLTIVIGLFFMQAMGFTLNLPTLIAIGMSIGILVTNSIVVMEAIIKRLDETGDPREAARLGAAEAFVAVLASAVTNIVVLFPLSAMHSMVGLFTAPFSLTMLIMTGVSLFISFTLTPMLCALILRPRDPDARGPIARMERGWNRGFDRVVSVYRRILQFNERHRWAAVGVIVLVVLMLLHSFGLAGRLGTTMMGDSDRGEVTVKVEFPTRYAIDETQGRMAEVHERLAGLPCLRHALTTVGKVEGTFGQVSEGVNLAQVLLRFNERTERSITLDELLADIRARLDDIPDATVTVSAPSMMGGQSSPIELEISGPDLDTLDALALGARDLAGEIDGLIDLDTTVRDGKPELRIRPRRAALADLGIAPSLLGMVMRGNLEGIEAGTFKRGVRTYDIVVKLDEREGRDQVDRFLLPGGPGRPVVLDTLGEVTQGTVPTQITRKDKQRVAKLFANLGPGKALGTAVAEISDAIRGTDLLPPGYRIAFAGEFEIMKEGQGGLAEAGLISIVLVVLSLAAILESFRQPPLILATLPLALIGIMWSLRIAGRSIEIFVLMGAVMLIGIVVNNAILILDQFNVHIAEGVPRHRAMIAAATERFRPIVMITLAAVLGMLPLALGRGIGAETRNGVGIASAGGILVSGVLTLFVIPVLYDLFTRRK